MANPQQRRKQDISFESDRREMVYLLLKLLGIATSFLTPQGHYRHSCYPLDPPWGNWEEFSRCGVSQYVNGFQLRYSNDSYQYVNGIRFFCSNPNDDNVLTISRETLELNSKWGKILKCNRKFFANMFRVRAERFIDNPNDNQLIYNAIMRCSNGVDLIGEGLNNGQWTKAYRCTEGTYLCSINSLVGKETANEPIRSQILDIATTCCHKPEDKKIQEILTEEPIIERIAIPKVTDWGNEGPWEYCLPGEYVVGFSLKVDAKDESQDKSGITAVKFYCSPSYEWQANENNHITSFTADFGVWRRPQICDKGEFVNGIKIIEQEYQGQKEDDIAAGNLMVHCTNDEELVGDGLNWGRWSKWHNCVNDWLVCGIQTQVLPEQPDGDNIGLNHINFACCNRQ